MKKSELEAKVVKLQSANKHLDEALTRIRQVARDCVSKGTQINHVWIIEKATEAFIRAEP